MGKTFSIKVLFGIYLLLMAGKVFAFSCNVDGGSSIGAGTTSVYVNLDPVIQPGQNLVVDLSQHISCWNDYGGWYDTDHINLVQGSAFAGSLQSYKGSLYWNNVTYPFPLTTNTNVLDIGDKTPMPLPGFAPIFPDTCYHLTHYWPAAVDIPVASDNPVHYADAIRYNARTPLQGSLLPLTRLV
ncbi:hypothetical protein WEE_01936 [Escherichia coli KTE23]|nr:hypothetical protein WEE_01936 [Escherichia coli KTE23]